MRHKKKEENFNKTSIKLKSEGVYRNLINIFTINNLLMASYL